MGELLNKFRATKGYKYLSYSTYVVLFLTVIFLLLFSKISIMQGMGVIIAVIVFLPIFLFYVCITAFGVITGISQVHNPEEQEQPSILKDIGALICFLFYIYWGFAIIVF